MPAGRADGGARARWPSSGGKRPALGAGAGAVLASQGGAFARRAAGGAAEGGAAGGAGRQGRPEERQRAARVAGRQGMAGAPAGCLWRK